MDDWFDRSRSIQFCFYYNRKNYKFELYTDTFDEFSFTELKDELEEIHDISKYTDDFLEDEIIGPRITKAYKKLETEKRQTDVYYMLILGYARPLFRNFESYLRMVVGLDEDDIQLILKQYNAKIVTYELDPGVYSIEDLQKAVYLLGDHERTLQIEYDDDDVNKKTNLF